MGECNEVFFHRNSKDTQKVWGMGEVEGGDREMKRKIWLLSFKKKQDNQKQWDRKNEISSHLSNDRTFGS